MEKHFAGLAFCLPPLDLRTNAETPVVGTEFLSVPKLLPEHVLIVKLP